MSRRGIGRIESNSQIPLKTIDITQKPSCGFAEAAQDDYFPLCCRRDFFQSAPPRTYSFLARLPQAEPHKEEKMADVKAPQRMNPQDIVKWLIALRRALQAKVT